METTTSRVVGTGSGDKFNRMRQEMIDNLIKKNGYNKENATDYVDELLTTIKQHGFTFEEEKEVVKSE